MSPSYLSSGLMWLAMWQGGKSIVDGPSSTGVTALMIAAYKGEEHLADLLIGAGANPDVQVCTKLAHAWRSELTYGTGRITKGKQH